MDALLLAVGEELGSYILSAFNIMPLVWGDARRVVGVKFDLIDGRHDFQARVG